MKRFLSIFVFCIGCLWVNAQSLYYCSAPAAVRVRSAAATDGQQLGVIKPNEQIMVYTILGDWAMVKWNNGIGYVAQRYLAKIETPKQPDCPNNVESASITNNHADDKCVETTLAQPPLEQSTTLKNDEKEDASTEKAPVESAVHSSKGSDVRETQETKTVLSSSVVSSKSTLKSNGFDQNRVFILGMASIDFAPQFSAGLMGGMTYQHVGWYLRAHTDFHAISKHSCKYSTKDTSIPSSGYTWTTPIEHLYTGDYERSEFSATAGLVVKTTSFLDVYIGVGYGQRLVNWKAKEFDTYGNTYYYWVRNDRLSAKNVAYDLGLLFHIKHVSLSAGVNVIGGYKDINFEIGIGGNF